MGSVHKAKTEMMSRNYFALIEILERWEERLGDISEESGLNEGYESREAYEATQVSNKRYLSCLDRLSSELNRMIRGGGRTTRALTNSAS